MRKEIIFPFFTFFAALVATFFSCQDIKVDEPLSTKDDSNISIDEAKNIINSKGMYGKKPVWELAEKITSRAGNIDYIHVPVIVEDNLTPAIPNSKGYVDETIKRLSQSELTHLFFYKDKKGSIRTEVITYIPDDNYYLQLRSLNKGNENIKFSGYVLIKSWEDKFVSGYKIKNDIITSELTMQRQSAQNGKARIADDACGSTQWMRCTCNTDPTNHYNCYCTVYGVDYFGCIYYPNPNPAAGSNSNLVYFTNGGGTDFALTSNGGINNYAVNANNVAYPYDSNEPVVSDLRDKLKCFSVGTNTSAYTYSITVYVDEPYPGSGSSISYSGNVGHVWVGFQKTNKQTGATATNSVGLYPNSYGPAAIRSGVSSNVKENSSHAADISITYVVDSNQFDKAVSSAIYNSNRSYSLENYNCTD